jgi:hypothetical protein
VKRLGVLLLVAACGGEPDGIAVAVDPSAPGRRVPADFLGLSIEWNNVRAYLGDGAGGARAVTVRLLEELAEEGQRPLLRIGGNSQDESWWNPTGAARPPGVTIDVGPADLSTLGALQRALGNQLVLGLNLALGDPDNAAAMVEAALAAIPAEGVQAIELGNEPDSYVPRHRAEPWDWAAYVEDVRAFRAAIDARVEAPLAFWWPSLAGRRWLPDLAAGMAAEAADVAVVSTHVYPYTVCNGLPPPAPLDLLHERGTVMVGQLYAPHAAAAEALGLPLRMGELNSVSCSGAPGVSDTHAAALWAADVAMQLAVAGVVGVNFHGGAPPGMPSHYAAWTLAADGAPRVQPLFYGLRLVALATASAGRVLPVEVDAGAPVRAFATLGDDAATRVLLLRVGADGPARVRLEAPGTAATLVRLTAPSLDARGGLSLGGMTWDGSPDGGPVGEPAPETLRREGDAWVVDLPAYDAAVVTMF